MGKTKKIKAYSFECPKCGVLEYYNTYNHSVPKQRICRYCGKIIKFTEHIIEVPYLPEVGRMVKIEDHNEKTVYGVVESKDDIYLYLTDIDKLKDNFVTIEYIVDWCYLKEDRCGK